MTAAGPTMGCSFRSGKANERLFSHGRMGRSPESSKQVQERGEIPHGALPMEWVSIVGHGTLEGEAAVGANREGHRGLVGTCIVGGCEGRRKS